MTKVIRFAQHNLNKSNVASLQLRDYCRVNNVDIVLAQEPVVQSGRVYGFEECRQILHTDTAGAAIIVLDDDLRVLTLGQFTHDYVIAIKISNGNETLTIVTAYFKYNMPTIRFVEILRPIIQGNPRTIIGADVNGHSVLWHSPDTNDRGQEVVDLINDFDLTVANKTGEIATYSREGMGTSNIDVTLLTPLLAGEIRDWRVQDITDSDHRVLTYGVNTRGNSSAVQAATRKYLVKKANWERYSQELIRNQGHIDERSIEIHAIGIVEELTTAANASIPKGGCRKPRLGKQPWWNLRLTELKNNLDRNRRLGQHIFNRPEYNRARNEYLREIRKAKMAAWRAFSEDLNIKTWGKAFKWAKNGSRKTAVPNNVRQANDGNTNNWDETADVLMSSFFPDETNPRDFIVNGNIERWCQGG